MYKAAGKVARQVRRKGLQDIGILEQLARKHVKGKGLLIGLSRRQCGTVQRRVAVAVAYASHVDVLTLDQGDAGNALQCLTRIGIGQLRDFLAANAIAHLRRILALCQQGSSVIVTTLCLNHDVLGRSRGQSKNGIQRYASAVTDHDVFHGFGVVAHVGELYAVGAGCNVLDAIRSFRIGVSTLLGANDGDSCTAERFAGLSVRNFACQCALSNH